MNTKNAVANAEGGGRMTIVSLHGRFLYRVPLEGTVPGAVFAVLDQYGAKPGDWVLLTRGGCVIVRDIGRDAYDWIPDSAIAPYLEQPTRPDDALSVLGDFLAFRAEDEALRREVEEGANKQSVVETTDYMELPGGGILAAGYIRPSDSDDAP